MRPILFGVALSILLPLSSFAGERTVALRVDNMTCALCPLTVSKAIKAVDGVTKVTVDYNTKRAVVGYDDTATSWEAIADASANAGYPAHKAE